MLHAVIAGVTLLAIVLQFMTFGSPSPWSVVFKIVTFLGLLYGILRLRTRVRQAPEPRTRIG